MRIENGNRVERAFLSDDPNSRRYVILSSNVDGEELGSAELNIYDGSEGFSFCTYPMVSKESLTDLYDEQAEIEVLIEYLEKYKVCLKKLASKIAKKVK